MSKILRQNIEGTEFTMAGCALTGVCASAAGDYVKQVTLTDGDVLSDGMLTVVTFANGNTAGNAPGTQTIYSSDQTHFYSDSALTQPFTLAPQGCYDLVYSGSGNAYSYISYPVITVGGITAPICDSCGKKTSGALWDAGDSIAVLFTMEKFMLLSVKTSDIVTDGLMRPVTSNAVADIMSNLPTDAVLHYSFDEVPDLPDGTAIYKKNNDFTDTSGWAGNATASVSNGKLTLVGTSGQYKYYTLNIPANNIIFIRGVANVDCTVYLQIRHSGASADTNLKTLTLVKGQSFEVGGIVDASSTNFSFFGVNAWGMTISAIYVGDGSYSTPIIDNAKGQNNATNNGGIATKGVSGKGAYFPSANQLALLQVSKFPAPNTSNQFTISLWLNISVSYTPDYDTSSNCIKSIFSIGQYSGTVGIVRNNNTIGIIVREANADNEYFISMDKGNWHNYVLVFRADRKPEMYVDGVLMYKATIANGDNIQLGSSQTTWHIWGNAIKGGGSATTTNQIGTIDNILIFDRALSETEVKALYLNKANTPKYYSWADWKLSQA